MVVRLHNFLLESEDNERVMISELEDIEPTVNPDAEQDAEQTVIAEQMASPGGTEANHHSYKVGLLHGAECVMSKPDVCKKRTQLIL